MVRLTKPELRVLRTLVDRESTNAGNDSVIVSPRYHFSDIYTDRLTIKLDDAFDNWPTDGAEAE